jgi:transglutaminase-like putative cysteine protease
VLYDIRHKTTFTYDEVVSVSHHVLHLRPRRHPQQICVDSETIVAPPPAVESVGEDYFGNPVQHLTVQKPHKTLVVDAHARIEVRSAAEPVALEESAPWETIRERLADYDALEAYEYVFASPYVVGTDDVHDYALQSFTPGRPILAAAMDLTSRIFHEFQYRGGVSNVSTPVSDVFAMRQGVCQDFAHLQIACLRSLGLAARYVSGYLLTRPPEGKEKLVGSDASHAWLSVYAGDAGWIDFDPTNDMIPGVDHITFAWGRDYGDVSPINGFIVGGGHHQVTVAVDVNPVAVRR